MRRFLRDAINRLLGRFGLRLCRAYSPDAAYAVAKHLLLVRDVERLFRESILPGLPAPQASPACASPHADRRQAGLPPDPLRPELLAAHHGTVVFHALHLLHCLHLSLGLPGDVCEFGCAAGATSALIANEMRRSDKNLWLFDSFQGLSRPGDKDRLLNDMFGLGAMERYEGQMSYPVADVKARLKAVSFPAARTRIVPGFIEQVVGRPGLPSAVCFAFVDFDLYSPIRTALHFLHARVSPGGFVLVHDYGFFSAGAKTAVDEFVEAHASDYALDLPALLGGHVAVIRRRD